MPQRTKKSPTSRKRTSADRRGDGSEKSAADSEKSSSDEEARLALQDSDKLYYRIGEVSALTGVKAHVLRYWETEFRWMAPPKSRSKQRLFRKRDIEFVWLLKRLLWDERYTIAGARQRIQDLGVEESLALLQEPMHVDSAADGQLFEGGSQGESQADWTSFRAALDEMRDELVSLRGALQDGA